MTEASTRPDWLPEHLFPFDSRRRTVAGCDVHYVDEGTGRPILFLHGNPTWSFLYRNVVLGLRDSFRCIAVDLPGFGLSTASEGYGFTPAEHAGVLEQFVVGLDLDDVTLTAQDWGGPIGLTVATLHPGRFSGLVLGNTWAWPLNGSFHFEAFARAFGNPLGKLLIGGANAFVNLTIPLGTATRLPAEVMRAYRAPLSTFESRRPTWELPRELLRSKPFLRRLEDDLPKITHLPALFVWGGGDVALRKGVELPRLEPLFPDHETVVLDGAKHFFQEDAPDRVVTEITRWMQARG